MNLLQLEHRFVDVFEVAARQAGAVASRFQGQVENEGKSAGGTPESDALSTVDLATQDIVLELLRAELPEIAVDAEEDTETVNLFAPPNGRPLVVLDPVDGTYSYLSGSKDWAVMAGLVADGAYRACGLLFPAFDVFLYAIEGEGCFRRVGRGPTERVSLARADLPRRVLVGPRMPEDAKERLAAGGDEVVVSLCSAVDATAPVLGRGLGSASHKRVDRRHSIGLLTVKEAGGTVLVGDREWRGEDPATPGLVNAPTVVAARAEDAERWMRALT